MSHVWHSRAERTSALNASRKRGESPAWTAARRDRSAIAFSPRFLRFGEFGQCAVARETVPFCALMGLVIPPKVVQLAWAVLEDRSATEREIKLACWVLLTTLRESRKV